MTEPSQNSPKMSRASEVGRVFTPSAPIDSRALFAGRKEQLRRIVHTINQKGQHAVLFGERGVGKTSLANILEETLRANAPSLVVAHVNCDSDDTYASIWRKVFSRVTLVERQETVGFRPHANSASMPFVEILPEPLDSAAVLRALQSVSSDGLAIIILDEFDRVRETGVRTMMADTLKATSDMALEVTVVLVGVADTVDELIAEHRSIERAIVQVLVPRMSIEELGEIVDKGVSALGMQVEPDARERITTLSAGLPHYTHLLSHHAAIAAIDEGSRSILVAHVESGIRRAIENAHQSTLSAYHRAVTSPRKDNLFKQVLLACALAPTDSLGYFSPSDVCEPLARIMGQPFATSRFVQHLEAFCKAERGGILQRIGTRRRYRYRFSNPMMQPYVAMVGFSLGQAAPPIS